ncbi:MAG: extracellular solute-binding protein [Chloroflexi bacterium]|jgi:ABC-type glycerol-3-phosphate transport system substrate-binding protein|nr:extracellular solute-binding protein [Chloroflexota bacterium]
MTTQQPKSTSRREFLKVAAFVGAGAALAACAPAAAPGAAPSAAPAVNTGARQTVRYLSWWFEEGNRGITWNNFIKEFNESQTDIEVVAENIPFDQYTTKTIVGAQSGELDGDIVMATPELAPRLIRSDLLAPLDDVLTRNNITDLSSAHDAMRKDGKIYGLDMVTVAFGLLYNSDRYAEANIAPAKTPEEWIEISKALTNRDEQKYGFFTSHLVSEPSDFWFQLEVWCMPYSGKWAEGKTPLLTSEPILQGLKLFKEMYDGAMPQGTDTPTGTRLFGTGAVAQEFIVSAAVGSLKPTYPEVYPKLMSAPIPWESNQSIARIHPMMVNASSAVKDAAIEFVAYMYNKENYRRMVEGCEDVIFAIPSAARQEYLDNLHWLKPGYDGVSYLTPFDIVGDFVYNFNEFGQIVISNFADALNGVKSVEEAMAVAQTQAEALAERIS